MPDTGSETLRRGSIGGIPTRGCIDEGVSGTILLLVLALGRVAIGGNSGAPISVTDNQPSGFRGGSLEEPPGLAEFNEARRRFGFLAVDCTIEYVQIMLLKSLYYESHCRHIDHWRCVTSASFAVQGLQKLRQVDWESFHGDQVKRAFWTCVIQEDFFHIDLDLPGTGINQREATVPLPGFHESPDYPEELVPKGSWVFHAQFLALIALRGIINRIYDAMYSSEGLLHFSIWLTVLSLTWRRSIRLRRPPVLRALCDSCHRSPRIWSPNRPLANYVAASSAMVIT